MVRASAPSYGKYLTIAHLLFENTRPQFENDDWSYSAFHTVSSNSCWNKIRRNFWCKIFWKSKSVIFLSFFFSAFRNSNLKMKDRKPLITFQLFYSKNSSKKQLILVKRGEFEKWLKWPFCWHYIIMVGQVKNDHFGLNLEIPKTHEKWLWRFSRLVLLKKWLEKSLRIWNMKSGKNGHFAKCSSNLFKSHLFCWLQICHRPDKHFGPLVIHKKIGRG